MKLFNYKILYGSSAYYFLDNLLKFTDEQKSRLKEKYGSYYYEDFPFDLLISKKHETPSFWWRLSYIPFVILQTILVLSMPIKYLITGNSSYSTNGKLKWVFEWGRKLNIL